MKKNILKTFVLTLILAVFFVATSVNAVASESFTEGYYTYTVTDNEASILRISEEASGELVIPDTLGGYPVRVLEEQAFYYCDKVTSVKISDNVREMKGGFGWNSLVEHIDFGDGVEEVEDDFYKTFFLKTVKIGKNLRTLPSDGFFDCCLSLEKIIVDEENPYFYSDEYGALYDKVNSVLMRYPEASKETSYTVAEGTKAIGPSAFSDSMYLESVTFPDSLEKIGYNAFSFSSGIKELHIPSSVKTIEDFAFVLSFSLEKLYFEADAEIGEYLIGTYIELLRPATEIAELLKQSYAAKANGDEDKANEFEAEFYNSVIVKDEIFFTTTICCHDDDKTTGLEEYAISYGMPLERSHFYADEWTYNWENNVRFRECTYEGCTASIEEQLEKEEIGDVEIIAPVDPDTDFEVDNIVEGTDNYILVQNALSETDYSLLKAFDITLKNKDGVHVQPDGTVKVKLPLDWEKYGNYKVYRINDDGTLTDMNAYRQGSHMVFETDHFSIYVIVEEGAQDEEGDKPVTEEKAPFDFLHKVFDLLDDLINLITDFFRSIGTHS